MSIEHGSPQNEEQKKIEERESLMARALLEGDDKFLKQLGGNFIKTETATERFNPEFQADFFLDLDEQLNDEDSDFYAEYRFLPKFSRAFVEEVANSREIKFLTLVDSDKPYYTEIGQELVNYYVIPNPSTLRYLARSYYERLQAATNEKDKKFYQEQIDHLKVKPVSNEEIIAGIKAVIARKWQQFSQ